MLARYASRFMAAIMTAIVSVLARALLGRTGQSK